MGKRQCSWSGGCGANSDKVIHTHKQKWYCYEHWIQAMQQDRSHR